VGVVLDMFEVMSTIRYSSEEDDARQRRGVRVTGKGDAGAEEVSSERLDGVDVCAS
jgi:hypothetical protein